MKQFSFRHGQFQVDVYTSLRDCMASWDQFVKNEHHLHSNQLLFVEDSKPDHLSFFYLLMHRDSEVMGVAYYQQLLFNSRNFQFNNCNILRSALLSLFRFASVKIIQCGNFFRTDFRCFEYDSAKISFEEFVAIQIQVRKNFRPSVFILKDTHLNEEEKKMLISNKFIHFNGDLTMEMAIPHEWNSFEDYLNALQKKYRQRARKVREQFQDVERKTFTASDLQKHAPEIEKLFRNVANKQTLQMGIVHADYFLNAIHQLGQRFNFCGYFLNGKLIGFKSTIERNTTLEIHFIGMDYEVNASHKLYFNILFDGIEDGISRKLKFVEMGRTAREAKAIVGGLPIHFDDYLLVNSSIIRWLIGFFRERFEKTQGEMWQNRHPFKSDSSHS